MPRLKDPFSDVYKKCPTCGVEFCHKRSKPKTYCSKTCSANSPVVKEKNRKMVALSFKKKYGGHPMAINEKTKQRLRSSLKEKYGVEFYSQADDFSAKVKSTLLKRYGAENYNNLEQMKATCLKNFGVDNYRKTQEYKDRCVESRAKKYGVANAPKITNHKANMLAKLLLSSRSPIEDSNFRSSVVEFIKSILPNEPIVVSNRAILSPQELDIYLPTKNIAIETNGLYWHTEVSGSKNKNYHLNKTKLCLSKGIRLIHVMESEWNHKREVVKSILKKILVKESTKIDAKECEVKEISSNTKSDFLINNHIQGNDHATVKLGLYHGKDLVSVMTFVKSRFDKKVEWEMSRFCSKLGHTIVGGSSKLFHHFVNTNKPKNVVSYSDRRYFSGETYLKLGFNFVSNTPPNYYYIIDNYDTLQNKINWQKAKLSKKLLSFDPMLSEWENMKLNNFDRIWDCGHSKWIWSTS